MSWSAKLRGWVLGKKNCQNYVPTVRFYILNVFVIFYVVSRRYNFDSFGFLCVTLYFNLVPENRFENIDLSNTLTQKKFLVFISESVMLILDLQRRNSTSNSSIRNTNIRFYNPRIRSWMYVSIQIHLCVVKKANLCGLLLNSCRQTGYAIYTNLYA